MPPSDASRPLKRRGVVKVPMVDTDKLEGYRDRAWADMTPDERVAFDMQQAREATISDADPVAMERMWMAAAAQNILDGMATHEDVRGIMKAVIQSAEDDIRAWTHMALEKGLEHESVKTMYHQARGWSQFLGLLQEIMVQGAEEQKRITEGA